MGLEINKVHCGDCLELMKRLPNESIDLIVTDPPYNLNKGFLNDNLEESEFIGFLSQVFNEFARVIKPKKAVIIFFDSGKNLPLFWRSLFKSNLVFQKGCTFYKPNDCSMPHNSVLRTSEFFFICSSSLELHTNRDKYIHDCLSFNYTKLEDWYHPTAKNIEVINECILSHTIENELVLDSFLGSGTTAVACVSLNRRFIGIEIEPKYVQIAERRIRNTREQTKLGSF